MIFFFSIAIIFNILLSRINCSDEYNSDCFYAVLEKTQSCDNKNYLYVTTMGQSSGLGSEFQAYLIPSLLEAISENRRMIYLKSKRKWEYDCSTKSGWACYLNFPCASNGVDYKDLDFSNQGNVHTPFLSPGSTFLTKTTINIENSIGKIKNIYDSFQHEKITLSTSQCDISKLTRTVMSSIIAKYLYKLNSETKALVRKVNSRYHDLHKTGYHSLQLRLSDKYYEMDFDSWVWMTDMSKTADMIRPYFASSNIKKLYTASDNCTAIGDLARILKPDGVTLYGSCFNESNNNLLNINKGSESTVRQGTYDSTIRLLADIEMLKRGEHFFGLFDSNLVRMIHYLRYPNLKNSHPLAVSTYTKGNKQGIDKRMHNLPWLVTTSCNISYCEMYPTICHLTPKFCNPYNLTCPFDFNPVCGCDNKTYGNSCAARYFGCNCNWTDGACI